MEEENTNSIEEIDEKEVIDRENTTNIAEINGATYDLSTEEGLKRMKRDYENLDNFKGKSSQRQPIQENSDEKQNKSKTEKDELNDSDILKRLGLGTEELETIRSIANDKKREKALKSIVSKLNSEYENPVELYQKIESSLGNAIESNLVDINTLAKDEKQLEYFLKMSGVEFEKKSAPTIISEPGSNIPGIEKENTINKDINIKKEQNEKVETPTVIEKDLAGEDLSPKERKELNMLIIQMDNDTYQEFQKRKQSKIRKF